jgi:hypothetical protein
MLLRTVGWPKARANMAIGRRTTAAIRQRSAESILPMSVRIATTSNCTRFTGRKPLRTTTCDRLGTAARGQLQSLKKSRLDAG